VKSNSISGCTAAILILLYAVSFIPSVRDKNKEKSIRSALMNKKYEDEVTEITISDRNNSIRLYRQNESDLWTGTSGISVFPADIPRIKKLITELTKVRSLYKISDSKDKWSSFLLDDTSAVIIQYKNSDTVSTKLYFGGQNFDKTRRYFRTENRIASYEIDSGMDVFLNSGSSSWYDSYIIPRNLEAVSVPEDIQEMRINGVYYTQKNTDFSGNCKKLEELRHGELTDVPLNENSFYTIEVEFGNGLRMSIQVYNADEGKILAYSFTNTLNGRKYDYNYAVRVSNWTFSRIEELFPPSRK